VSRANGRTISAPSSVAPAEHAEVVLQREQPLPDRARVVHRDLELQPGIAPAQALPEGGRVVAGAGRRGGHAQPRAAEVARALQRALGVERQREDALGVLAQRLARRREPHAAADPVEEAHAVLALQRADLEAHGGDGHVQPLGGLGEGARPRHRLERPQLREAEHAGAS
jgi:hypothetical protein